MQIYGVNGFKNHFFPLIFFFSQPTDKSDDNNINDNVIYRRLITINFWVSRFFSEASNCMTIIVNKILRFLGIPRDNKQLPPEFTSPKNLGQVGLKPIQPVL